MPTKKALKEKAKQVQRESVSMSRVCDFLGKKCSGPVQFYLRENNTTGIRVLLEADGTAPPPQSSSDPEFSVVKEKDIAYSLLPPSKLKILTKIDLDISQLEIVSSSGTTETFPIQKQSSDSTMYYKNYQTKGNEVSPRWIYTVDMSKSEEGNAPANANDENLIEALVNAFVLAILSDRKENPDVSADPATGGASQGNGVEGNAGADVLGPLGQT
jgi:hypothetical protein